MDKFCACLYYELSLPRIIHTLTPVSTKDSCHFKISRLSNQNDNLSSFLDFLQKERDYYSTNLINIEYSISKLLKTVLRC